MKETQYHIDEMRKCGEDCEVTWYTVEAYREIRSNTRKDICKARAYIRKKSGLHSFTKTLCTLMDLTSNVGFPLDDATCLLTPSTEQVLALLYKKSTEQQEGGHDDDDDDMAENCANWIGLERYLYKEFRRESKQRQGLIHQIVSAIQGQSLQQDKKKLWTNHYSSSPSSTLDTTELRDSCRSLSQSMALLAQLLARAQLALT